MASIIEEDSAFVEELTYAVLTAVFSIAGYMLFQAGTRKVSLAHIPFKTGDDDTKRVACDFGGVIADGRAATVHSDPGHGGDGVSPGMERHEGFLSEDYLRTPAVPGSFEGIKELTRTLGEENVFVISKCGLSVERKTLEWMEHKDFYEATGVPRENVIFCREHADKAEICTRVRITHLVDDKFAVLRHLSDRAPNTLGVLFKPADEQDLTNWHIMGVQQRRPCRESKKKAPCAKRGVTAWDWKELLGVLAVASHGYP